MQAREAENGDDRVMVERCHFFHLGEGSFGPSEIIGFDRLLNLVIVLVLFANESG